MSDSSDSVEGEGEKLSKAHLLFNGNCIACHGEDAKGLIGPDIRGKSVAQIQYAIAKVPFMLFLSFLTTDEIELLASHLNTLGMEI